MRTWLGVSPPPNRSEVLCTKGFPGLGLGVLPDTPDNYIFSKLTKIAFGCFTFQAASSWCLSSTGSRIIKVRLIALRITLFHPSLILSIEPAVWRVTALVVGNKADGTSVLVIDGREAQLIAIGISIDDSPMPVGSWRFPPKAAFDARAGRCGGCLWDWWGNT